LDHFGPIGPDNKNRKTGGKHAIDTSPLAAASKTIAAGTVATLGNALFVDLL
jgi:hypothetical protein